MEVNVVNTTMELRDVKSAWSFNEKYRCWCLEDILYTPKPVAVGFQRMSIFVPEAYLNSDGEINPDGIMNGYTAKSVPVIFENNAAGYAAMPHTWLDGPRMYAYPYLEQGYIYITCGGRGRDIKDDKNEYWCGKAPWGLIDYKTALRFLRHNSSYLPGNYDRIISVGWSAGGAMSTLLGVCGDNPHFNKYLEGNGAFMDESDAVYASQIYCPIIDLDHADIAYEWIFHNDTESEDSPAGPGGPLKPYNRALSDKMYAAYIRYFNSLKLKDSDTGAVLSINPDGRSGSGYDYLMKKLNASATKYLTKLTAGELPLKCSAEDYLSGNYTILARKRHAGHHDDNVLQGFMGQEVNLNDLRPAGDKASFSMGTMMLRPKNPSDAKPNPRPPFPDPEEVQGDDKHAWLTWDGKNAVISDLDTYLLGHRRRMKGCPSFDILNASSGENETFGTDEIPSVHFSPSMAACIAELKDRYPKETAVFSREYAESYNDEGIKERVYLYNPLSYICTEEKSTQAKFYRIRVGAQDADTSFMISASAALRLAEAGFPVDYELVWDQPHSEADYPGEVISWIESIVK